MSNISAVNLGERLTRISKVHIEAKFPQVETVKITPPETINIKSGYSLNECYTVGEITEKFKVSATTVNRIIRKNSILKKQIGRFVYVPKAEIDRIFSHR